MAERMTEEQILFQEKLNTGTAHTHNEFFEENGYLVIKNLWAPEELYHPLPPVRGQLSYWGERIDQVNYEEVESQVEGSLARYWHPQYRQIHSGIRMKLEEHLGRKLYNTYYYDRYYFPGQELTRHADRDACEISVTVHISTNLEGKDADWPIWIKTPDTYTDKTKSTILVPGENRSVILKPGDGMVYKGCERPHWRDSMPGNEKKSVSLLDKLFRKQKSKSKPELYYHQIFFHYVLQDGRRSHCAWDRAR